MRSILLVLALYSSASMSAEPSDIDFDLASSLPRVFWANLRASQGHDPYALSAWLNPFYLQGDFNGDRQTDFAVLIEEKSSGKRGLIIVHINEVRQFVVGAGIPSGNGGDDFTWMDAWQVYPRGTVESGSTERAPPSLLGDALLAIKTEAASGLIYWSGDSYEWYQQGD